MKKNFRFLFSTSSLFSQVKINIETPLRNISSYRWLYKDCIMIVINSTNTNVEKQNYI